jgi:hypothetical protein
MTASIRLKIAVLAPMPSASDRIAAAGEAGRLRHQPQRIAERRY